MVKMLDAGDVGVVDTYASSLLATDDVTSITECITDCRH